MCALQSKEERRRWLERAHKQVVGGWLHITVSGSPLECGYQHGSLVASEFAQALATYKEMTFQTTGKRYEFFVEHAVKLHKHLIPEEFRSEMEGIALGLTDHGVPTTLDDVIGWNAWMEIVGNWWPQNAKDYVGSTSRGASARKLGGCSAFIATGSATTDGEIVIGHESFTEFWNGQFMNVILDITPEEGHRIVMQTSPGWIASMTDFYVTSAGLAIVETTIAGYSAAGYDATKSPEYVRARKACQYASDIESWVRLITENNNGGYANTWLVGDIDSGEIASYELGLLYQDLKRTHNGYYFGCNAVSDPRIRYLECRDTGYNDVRQQTGARRVRWLELLEGMHGRIDAEAGQRMLADTYDVYLNRTNPSSRTICAHYDVDPQPYVSDPAAVWNVPFYPAGSVDGKLTTAKLARDMEMLGIFGRADGVPFYAEEFLRRHPQWGWQQGHLKDRPSQAWVRFKTS